MNYWGAGGIAALFIIGVLHGVVPHFDNWRRSAGLWRLYLRPAGRMVALLLVLIFAVGFASVWQLGPLFIWVLAVGAMFFTGTAIVHEEGQATSRLVITPVPTFATIFLGKEEGSWKREHPDEPRPWFLRGKGATLIRTDCEGGAGWIFAYETAHRIWMISTIALAVAAVGRVVFDRF